MRLSDDRHLAYCTNIHRGESWGETFAALQRHTLAVRDRVCPPGPYAIGLRLGCDAARELSEPQTVNAFRRWLEHNNCYVFTINGFPYGRFHGTRVKEQVYSPDWTTRERLEYTCALFKLLAGLLPTGVEGSVSTVPVSFKSFIMEEAQLVAARDNLWHCIDYLERLQARTGKILHLGLEPEPLCYLETSEETVRFFETMRRHRPGDARLGQFLGVNYDCCHLAIEFESATAALDRLIGHGIKISKVHLSNALAVFPTVEACNVLRQFQDQVYLHQVVVRGQDGTLTRHRDLDVALAACAPVDHPVAREQLSEWRVHFHIPLHSPPQTWGGNTVGHVCEVLDRMATQPGVCRHFEMETYTWEVMPASMRAVAVVDQLAAEYQWTLGEFAKRGVLAI
ncbi:MAG: metabolite traffic protein EboE [Verrucomicrobiota bacterium]